MTGAKVKVMVLLVAGVWGQFEEEEEMYRGQLIGSLNSYHHQVKSLSRKGREFVIIFQIGDRESTYDQFLADLCVKDGDADDCRYAIYDYEYVVHAQGTEASHR